MFHSPLKSVCASPLLLKMYFYLMILIWHYRKGKVPHSTLVPVQRSKPADRGDAERDTLVSRYWLLFSINFYTFFWTEGTQAATGMCTNRVVCLLSFWRRLNRLGLVSGPLGGGFRIWCIFLTTFSFSLLHKTLLSTCDYFIFDHNYSIRLQEFLQAKTTFKN